MKTYDVLIIGGGPAGFMAGISALKLGKSVLICEHTKDVLKKILISGKGRCNITNSCDIDDFIMNFPRNGRFLYSAFNAFNNIDLISFFEENGIHTKVERGGRVFPVSDNAHDVKKILIDLFKKKKGEVITNIKIKNVIIKDNAVKGVRLEDKKEIFANKIIIATGGISYPKTGSNGSGYILSEKAGHKITDIKPSLVPLESDFPYLNLLQGLSLRNVVVKVFVDNKEIKRDFGEMLFTHFGVSGPIILTLSNLISDNLSKNKKVQISIDFKPALTEEKLDLRIQRDFNKFSKKQIKNALFELMPSSLIPVMLKISDIEEDKFINQIPKIERKKLLKNLKDFRINITNTRPIDEAIVTSGGVSTKDINPKTMESKVVKGLFFAGEIIDIDGYTGGFNLQAAFSTGFLAGTNAAMDS